MPHGGKRNGSGRKPKAEEQELIERLSPLDQLFFDAMKEGLTKKDLGFCKMFADYRFGKPKEKVEHSGDMSVSWNEIRNYGRLRSDREADDSPGLSTGS